MTLKIHVACDPGQIVITHNIMTWIS